MGKLHFSLWFAGDYIQFLIFQRFSKTARKAIRSKFWIFEPSYGIIIDFIVQLPFLVGHFIGCRVVWDDISSRYVIKYCVYSNNIHKCLKKLHDYICKSFFSNLHFYTIDYVGLDLQHKYSATRKINSSFHSIFAYLINVALLVTYFYLC